MKNKVFYVGMFVCGLMALSSCGNDDLVGSSSLSPSFDSEAPASSEATLTVGTRGDDPASAPANGRIYVFSSTGKCVSLLSTDTSNPTASAKLPSGTYTICALGASDLSPYKLPERVDATAASLITLKTGEQLNELFMATKSVTLEEGIDQTANIALTRTVACIDDITITQVPATVTAVSVEIGELYTAVQLNGNFPAAGYTETVTVALEQQTDNTTWKASPDKLVFPSKGNPTLTMTLTTVDGTDSYSFELESAIQANKHATFTGQYQVPIGATLQCTMTTTDWDEPQSLGYDIDADHAVFKNLTQGTFHNGYYIVSLDASARTAVLLAKEEIHYDKPASGDDNNTNPLWLQSLTSAMSSLALPTGITSGTWRLPTLAEADIFLRDTRVAPLGPTSGMTDTFFCTHDGALKWTCLYPNATTSVLEQHKGTTGFSYPPVYLRPVLDITY